MIARTDPVGVLCDLIEAGNGTLDATAVRERSNAEIEFLTSIGAVTAAEPSSIVTCRACDNDHVARLEFDPSTRRHWHFCPEAGRVTVEDTALATLRAEPQWLVDWFATALPLTPPVRKRELVRDIACYCGDAHVGGTALTVVLGIGMSVRRNLEALAAAIPAVPRTQLGLVLTTTADPPRRLALPHDYKLLDIREIVAFRDNGLTIDKAGLGAWLKGFRKRLDKPAAVGAGRPSRAQLTEKIFQARRARNIPVTDNRAEAKAIRAEMNLQYPDFNAPAGKTIERHLRQANTQKW
jgi:hypothetical protein